MATVKERIFEVFRNHKLETIFGNPGSTELPFLSDFPSDFTYVLGLHEGTVVGMAMGYSLAKNEPALVNLHTTAGTGNAMGAIVSAWHGQIPLIITAGQQDRRQISTEPFLWGRQVDFVKPYVKWSREPERSIDVPQAIERAYHIANTDPKGPVFVSIPMDGLDQDCPQVETRKVSHTMAPNPEAISDVAKILSKANNIALIAGEQIDAAGAMEDFVRLAETLRAAVFLSPIAYRWSFPSTHVLFAGRLPPAMKPIGERLAPYDTVLAVGCAVFTYYPYAPGPPIQPETRVIQFTNDPAQASRAIAGTSVIGNVSLSVNQLLERVEQRNATPLITHKSRSPAPTSIPPTAECVHERLAEAIPENAIIFTEDPSSEPYFRAKIAGPRSYFETPSGGLGFAMPAAIGAGLAGTNRPVVCILGDGSAQYCIQALWSASEYSANVTFIVLNNSEYAILKGFGMFLGEKGFPGLDVPNIDFEGICKGYGVGFKLVVDPNEITKVVHDSIDSRKSTLIEIPIDRSVHRMLG